MLTEEPNHRTRRGRQWLTPLPHLHVNQKMKRIIAIALLSLKSLSLFAVDTFTINGKEIAVPAPKGFVHITDDMTGAVKIVQEMADPMNDTLAHYIMESDVPAAMAGEVLSLERTFILKVNKQLRNMTVGKNDFSQLKNITKSQKQKIFEDLKAQIPELMNNMSQGISQEFNVDFTMNIAQMVPLEPHYEAENALAFSMYINYGVFAEDENIEEIISATSTFLYASGTVLFLYGYAPKDELEWTRSASMSWAESIMASNSQLPAKSPGRGIDWNKVMGKGLVGAIVGGLFALLAGAATVITTRKKG